MSLGGGLFTAACDSNALKPAIDSLRSVQIATVIATGNNGSTNSISGPGCISSAISVGATDNSDNVASFSNRANFMSLYAPGLGINSSIPTNSFAAFSGTSMATPHVAGAWAVMKSGAPAASVSQILAAFQSTGRPITNSGFTKSRIQLDAALNSLLGSPATPTRTATATATVTLPTGNLALNKAATADSSCNANETAAKAVNGSWTGGNSDKWCSSGASKWWQVDLGANFNVNQFVIQHAGAGGESATFNTRAFNLQVSTDNVNWTTPVTVTANTANSSTHNITATGARYIRLNVITGAQSGANTARIYEVLVYGSSGQTSTPTRTNTPGPSLTPTRTRTPTSVAAGVIFYQDVNFGGAASAMLAKGDYAVMPASVPNDWMSSLRVPAGWIVDAYADGNFGGAVCTYTADTSWVGSACNDVMSSFRIR